MTQQTFKILASHCQETPPDWREQLIQLLGSKPRRLSQWCELGMWGALSCIHQTEQKQLSSKVDIRICTLVSTINATQSALDQAQDDLPMPFTFMQTQPGQLLNALGTALSWHGDGYTTCSARQAQGEIALLHSFEHSALLGLVDEKFELTSRWIWLEKSASEEFQNWQAVDSLFNIPQGARWLAADQNGVRVKLNDQFFDS